MMSFKRILTSSSINCRKLFDFQKNCLSTLNGKDFLSLGELTNAELEDLLATSLELKRMFKTRHDQAKERLPLKGKTMSMIFQKRSTRTRVSTETGIHLLGGHALMLGPSDIQLGVNETMRGTGKTLISQSLYTLL